MSVVTPTRPERGERPISAGHLGATLRSVLVSPRAGFDSSLRGISRRRRQEARPAEGISPYILAAAGGAAGALLWLKVSSLIGLREDSDALFQWFFIPLACLLGGALSLAAQFLWGVIAPKLIPALGGEIDGPRARLVWGAAAFPQVGALLILLPCDLLISGTDTFTSAQLPDPVASIWASLSVAFAVALTIWALALSVIGVQVATGLRLRDAVLASAASFSPILVLVILLRIAAIAVAGDAG